MNLASLALLSLPLALVACSRSESAPAPRNEPAPAPTPTAPAVAPPAPITAPAPVATADDDGDVVHWKIPGEEATVRLVDEVDAMKLRVTTRAASIDLKIPGSGTQRSLTVVGDSVVYQVLDSVPNKHGDAVLVFRASRIAWNATTNTAVIADTWKCREDAKACHAPAWVGAAIEPSEGMYE